MHAVSAEDPRRIYLSPTPSYRESVLQEGPGLRWQPVTRGRELGLNAAAASPGANGNKAPLLASPVRGDAHGGGRLWVSSRNLALQRVREILPLEVLISHMGGTT